MGENSTSSWDEHKRSLNIAAHGYDFRDIEAAFDGRFIVVRQDIRHVYGELRYNSLVEYENRIISRTFTPRVGKIHLISVRPASRNEKEAHHGRLKSR